MKKVSEKEKMKINGGVGGPRHMQPENEGSEAVKDFIEESTDVSYDDNFNTGGGQVDTDEDFNNDGDNDTSVTIDHGFGSTTISVDGDGYQN